MADQTFAVHCGFFDAINSDRTYSADEMNRPYKRVISNGVFATPQGTPSTDLQVTASSGMNIICKKGEGLFGDKWFENPSGIAITVPSNTGTVPRIDSVLVQVDTRTSGRVGNIVHRTGTPASSPVPPAINQVEGVIEYRLANIRVNAGVSAITGSMITDRRGSSDCPWVTSLIYQVDTSTLYNQWQAAYAEYFEQEKAIWDAWYAQLTEDLDVSMTLDRHTNTVTTTDRTFDVSIGLDYNHNTDILEVYINGLRAVEGTQYIVNDDVSISLINPVSSGQSITFVVMRSVISGSATNITVLLQELESQIAGIAGGTPTVVDSTSDMTDTEKIYILSSDSKWYYYSTTAEDWVIGGTYGGVPTDPTLTQAGMAADAKATGDALALKADDSDVTALETRLAAVEDDIDSIRETTIGKNLIDPDALTVGALQADGTISTASSWANYYTTDFVKIDANTDYTFTAYDKTTHVAVEKRILCMLYNASKEYISASYQNVNNTAKLTIDGDDGVYVRFSSPNAYDYQLEKGSVSTSYEKYNKRTELLINLGEVPSEQVAEIVDDKIGEIVYTLNLVNPNTLTTGAIQPDGTISEASSFAAYSTTDFIPLDANTDYTFSIFDKTTHATVTQRKMCLLYDSAKTHIAASYQNVNNAEKVSISSGDAAYVRLSAPTLYDMQLEVGDDASPYIGYEKTMNTKLGGDALEQVESVTHDNLKGKKWAVCGDSFTSGATATKISSGVYAGQNYVYPYLIGNRTGIDVVRFFASGQTLAFPENPDTFVNSLTYPNGSYYYQNIPSDVDYITIYLGINDEHHSSSGSGGDGEDNTGIIPIGTVDDNTTATYLGAWNVVLTWLITNRPNAHIGMIVTNGNANKDEYRQGQISIAEKYGIPYIDLNGDARTPAMLRTSNPNIASAVKTALINKWAVDPVSNTHPNDDAHEFESYFIENFLRSI